MSTTFEIGKQLTKRRIRGMSIVELLVVTTVVGGAAAALLVRQAQIDRQQKVQTAVNTISTIYDYARSLAGVSRDFTDINSASAVGTSELRVIAKNLRYDDTRKDYTDGTFRYKFSGDTTSFSLTVETGDAAICSSLGAALREGSDYLAAASPLTFAASNLGNLNVGAASYIYTPESKTIDTQRLTVACNDAKGLLGVTYLNGQSTF
jgi:type II secretory pathway pseudopilin PulG